MYLCSVACTRSLPANIPLQSTSVLRTDHDPVYGMEGSGITLGDDRGSQEVFGEIGGSVLRNDVVPCSFVAINSTRQTPPLISEPPCPLLLWFRRSTRPNSPRLPWPVQRVINFELCTVQRVMYCTDRAGRMQPTIQRQ